MKRIIISLARLAAMAAALVGGAGGIAAALGGLHPALDLVAQFTPWLALAGLLGLLCARLLNPGRGRRAWTALAALGLAGALAVMGPELIAAWRQPEAATRSGDLRVVQYNFWANNLDPDASMGAVSAAAPDLVVLQEAFAQGTPAGRLIRRSHPYGARPGAPVSARVMSRRPGRHDILQEDTLEVARFRTTLPNGAPVTVLGVHYVWPNPLFDQARQRRALARVVERHRGETLIVTGDLNLTPWSAAMREQDRVFARHGLERRTRALATWPATFSRFELASPFPWLPIDHVYASKGLQTVQVRRLPRTGSDHYPVLVVLRPTSPRP